MKPLYLFELADKFTVDALLNDLAADGYTVRQVFQITEGSEGDISTTFGIFAQRADTTRVGKAWARGKENL